MVKTSIRKKIVVVTPSFSGGSWVASEKILKEMSLGADIFIVGLGKVLHRDNKLSYFSIPYPKYELWGRIHSSSPYFALIWNIPLLLTLFIFLILKRPNLVISNGFSSSLLLSPIIKIVNSNFIILYHGILANFTSNISKSVIRNLSRYVDLVVVNSIGSKDDISQVVSSKKIIINKHYAEDLFFTPGKIKKNYTQQLRIIYAGSLNKEKLFYPLVEIAKKLKNNKKFYFTFVGIGTLESEIKALSQKSNNIRYMGYVGNRKKLKNLYENADVAWSSADETYLTMPAVEALATGTPIIIPKYPGIYQKKDTKIKVSRNIVPEKVGWLVDPYNLQECYQLIINIQKKGINQKMKNDCYTYALKNYTSANIESTVKSIKNFI